MITPFTSEAYNTSFNRTQVSVVARFRGNVGLRAG